MAGVPTWSAVRNGLLGDPGAVNTSASINQFLDAHSSRLVYAGGGILGPNGQGGAPSSLNLGINDWSQPLPVNSTVLGRVLIPVASVGNGADLNVLLFTDVSGSPGTMITSTRVAAKMIAALVATAGLAAGSAPPLATAATNSLTGAPGQTVTYATPAASATVGLSQTATVAFGNNMLLVGGADAVGDPVAGVYSIAYGGGTTLAPAVPQPALPLAIAFPGAAATPDTLVVAGGNTGTTGTTASANVYTASLNTSTGNVGSWSVQTSLPQPLFFPTLVSSGENVYSIGGENSSGTPLANVYWTAVQNGQITAWNNGPSLPATFTSGSAFVVNGYLVAIDNISMYYTLLNPDGSLVGWQVGASPFYGINLAAAVATGTGIVAISQYFGVSGSTNATEALTVGPEGPANRWTAQDNNLAGTYEATQAVIFPSGNGTWQLFSLFPTVYYAQQMQLVPMISVPLPASGLTSGSTYHVVLSQQGGDSTNNYLLTGWDKNAYSGGLTAQYRARSGGSGWTNTTAGEAIPITLFNQAASGNLLHFYEDGGARIGTPVTNSTPDFTPLGYIEQVQQPPPVLNANPYFTVGTAPWAATGGTLTRSSVHTHGNTPFSALLTPSGSASSAYIESEQNAVFQGHSYVAAAWQYSNLGYGSVAVNINWYSASHALLSTSSGTVTALAAATWTPLSTTGAAPAGAAYATIVAAETGTPPSAAVLYVSAATLQDASGPILASVTQINYTGTGTNQVPVGITQLA